MRQRGMKATDADDIHAPVRARQADSGARNIAVAADAVAGRVSIHARPYGRNYRPLALGRRCFNPCARYGAQPCPSVGGGYFIVVSIHAPATGRKRPSSPSAGASFNPCARVVCYGSAMPPPWNNLELACQVPREACMTRSKDSGTSLRSSWLARRLQSLMTLASRAMWPASYGAIPSSGELRGSRHVSIHAPVRSATA